MSEIRQRRISLWIKIPYTLFVCVLVPVYWYEYGVTNLLWFSDIALLLTLMAVWLEDSLLASMMALSALFLDGMWNVDFFVKLLTGKQLTGLAWYMFYAELSLWLRALSLFHIFLPPLLLWMMWRLGYDRRAFIAQTLLAWVVLPLSYFVAGPEKNINAVYGISQPPQECMPEKLYLLLLMLFFPLCIYLPTHLVLKRFFSDRQDKRTAGA